MPDQRKIIRIFSFSVYFLLVFFAFVVIRFPYDRIKARIESEVRTSTPFELNIARISPRFLNRFVLSDVVVSNRTGTVLFESRSLRTHVSLFGFLRGLLSVDFRGMAYGGELVVRTEQGAKRRFWSADIDNMDIGSYSLLKELGYKISGRLGGKFEMENNAGKVRLWLKNLAARELRIKGFPVPDLDFEQGWIEGEIKGDRFTIRKFELDGRELSVRISGDLVMRERGTLNLVVKLKPSERLSREQAGLLSFLKSRDAEGFHQFSLSGALDSPLPRF